MVTFELHALRLVRIRTLCKPAAAASQLYLKSSPLWYHAPALVLAHSASVLLEILDKMSQ